MSRRMSCSMTVDAVRDRTKTVTRRHVDTWRNLQAGDRLTLVEKAMGLPKGARQVVLAEVEVVEVVVEYLSRVDAEECDREGLSELTPEQFRRVWADSHGYKGRSDPWLASIECRRIEWRYLDEEPEA